MEYTNRNKCIIKPFSGSYTTTSASHIYMAKHLDAGNSLELLLPLLLWKLIKGTRLIAEPNGNKVKDWTIRSVTI
jgi:hypothetical protein